MPDINYESFVSIQPMDKAEFVIRSHFIHELNAAFEKEPAQVFCITREGTIAVSNISNKEYERLKKMLLS